MYYSYDINVVQIKFCAILFYSITELEAIHIYVAALSIINIKHSAPLLLKYRITHTLLK